MAGFYRRYNLTMLNIQIASYHLEIYFYIFATPIRESMLLQEFFEWDVFVFYNHALLNVVPILIKYIAQSKMELYSKANILFILPYVLHLLKKLLMYQYYWSRVTKIITRVNTNDQNIFSHRIMSHTQRYNSRATKTHLLLIILSKEV